MRFDMAFPELRVKPFEKSDLIFRQFDVLCPYMTIKREQAIMAGK
jgi:hypothetical protein